MLKQTEICAKILYNWVIKCHKCTTDSRDSNQKSSFSLLRVLQQKLNFQSFSENLVVSSYVTFSYAYFRLLLRVKCFTPARTSPRRQCEIKCFSYMFLYNNISLTVLRKTWFSRKGPLYRPINVYAHLVYECTKGIQKVRAILKYFRCMIGKTVLAW